MEYSVSVCKVDTGSTLERILIAKGERSMSIEHDHICHWCKAVVVVAKDRCFYPSTVRTCAACLTILDAQLHDDEVDAGEDE